MKQAFMSDGQAYADSQPGDEDGELSAFPPAPDDDVSSARYDVPSEGAGSPGPERPFMVRYQLR